MWYGRATVYCCMTNLALIVEGVDMEAARLKSRYNIAVVWQYLDPQGRQCVTIKAKFGA